MSRLPQLHLFGGGAIIKCYCLPSSLLVRLTFTFCINPLCSDTKFCCLYQSWSGGHTRLEAKTKATQKIQGQGQPFRGQTLFEAKDRNARGQGPRTQPQVFSKKIKKGLQKSFSGNFPFTGVPRIFDWGRPKPQITCYDVIKTFQKRNFLWNKDIVGWKI